MGQIKRKLFTQTQTFYLTIEDDDGNHENAAKYDPRNTDNQQRSRQI